MARDLEIWFFVVERGKTELSVIGFGFGDRSGGASVYYGTLVHRGRASSIQRLML